MHYRNRSINLIYIFIFFSAVICAQRPLRSTEMPLKVEGAADWDEIFRRQTGSGWFSGDGIYSVPFNGDDTMGSGENTKTYWLFSDSRIGGPIDPVSRKITSSKMNKHTVAVLDRVGTNEVPVFDNMTYHFGGTIEAPEELFGQRLWALDGISISNVIHMNMSSKDDANRGVFRVSVPVVNDEADFDNFTIVQCPYYEAISADHKSHARLGSAILDLTVHGGFTDQTSDHYGYVYNYGMRKWNTNRAVVVGRVKREDYTDFSKWEYWNGANWVVNNFSVCTAESAELFGQIGDRYSVSYITEGVYAGKFLFINVANNNEPIIEYRYADSPLGPWSDIVPMYAPLKEMDAYGVDSVNFYNAKAHPHLSRDGKLLVSYCANVKQVRRDYLTSDKNRGRFIWVDLHNKAEIAPLHLVSQEMSASASTGTNPHYAFGDNVEDTKAWMATGANQWLQVDLGQTCYVSRWQVLHQGWIREDVTGNTRDFQLEKSDDGINWEVVDVVTGNTADITDRDFPETGARYWRMYITESNSNSTDDIKIVNMNLFGRFHPYKSIPNENICVGKPITAGGNSSDKELMVDGDMYSKWVLDGDAGNQWFYVDLEENYLIDRVDLRSGVNRNDLEVYNVCDFDISVSDDAINWDVIREVKYNINHKARLEFDGVSARYIKVEIKKAQQGEGTAVKIYELEAFGHKDTDTFIHSNTTTNGLSLELMGPNPVTFNTKFSYSIPNDDKVSLKVYNNLGQEVAVLASGYKSKGNYEGLLNINSLSSGIYIAKLLSGKDQVFIKFVIKQ
ncbi:T9SS type A sorting domain-containing protein [Labilibacter sediminis]|nr:T9SS type A sorting domain-containing protein [Labilibacter sediminis]